MIIDEKRLADMRNAWDHSKMDVQFCSRADFDALAKTLEKLWKVARAAEKIVRPFQRQSKENAPLEYALWKALDALKAEAELK